jgi:hypothetical protein
MKPKLPTDPTDITAFPPQTAFTPKPRSLGSSYFTISGILIFEGWWFFGHEHDGTGKSHMAKTMRAEIGDICEI